jgi:PAS domain S-box-containing protein
MYVARGAAEGRTAPEARVPMAAGDNDLRIPGAVVSADEPPLKTELYALVQRERAIVDFLQDGSLDGIWYLDIEHPECCWLSPRFKAVFGYGEHELDDTNAFFNAQIHADDLARAQAAFGAHLADPRVPYDETLRYWHKDGSIVWVRCRGMAIRDTTGRPVRMLGAHSDITSLKRAELARGDEMRSALQSRQTLVESIVATSPGAVLAYRLGPDGRHSFPFVSDSAVSLYGVEISDLTRDADTVFSRGHPDDVARMRGEIAESARTLTSFQSEWRYLHPTRGYRWLWVNFLPVRDPDGGTTWNGVAVDVTEQKERELELSIVKSQLDAALEAADMGAFVVELDTRTVWQSEAMHALYGFLEPGPARMSFEQAMAPVHVDDRERIRAEFEHALDKGGQVQFEFRIRRPRDGVLRQMSLRGRVVRDARGVGQRLVGIATDVTQQKIAAESQARSHKLEALGTLAGGIAHDFNNVLQAVTGRAALALNALASEHPARQHVSEISKAAVHASELVSRILGFSRPAHEQRRAVVLADVVSEALGLVRATVPTSIELRVQVASDVPAVTADPTEVHQIVINLATNAAHAIGRKRGVIEVGIERVRREGESAFAAPELAPGWYVQLSVSDDGVGMDGSTLARVFDPYFTTKPVGEGTGLGLAVVASLMRSLGGTVNAYSQPGKGTTFRLYFPVASGALPEALPAPRPSLPRGSGERVLFVDDELALAALGREMLRHLGYEADVFNDPERALEAFRTAPDSYAVAITDLSMPGLSGAELARELLAVRPDLPVVLMSGYAPPDERERALSDGVARILGKPVSLPVFATLLSELVERRERA